MSTRFEFLPVSRGDKAVYDLAEKYFVARLTAHFRPLGYDCYREYEYGGGSALMPVVKSAGHADPRKARILHMLQGGDDAYGFRFLTPREVNGSLKERGFQKPDFLAFRVSDGVVAEVGTANMRADKLHQLNSRLRDLQRLVDEEMRVQSYASSGRPMPWHGMRWRAADYHPEEGGVVIAVDANRLISTHPTFEPKTNGLYLYQLLRYEAHRLRVGVPVVLPRFTGAAENQLRAFWQSYRQPGSAGSKAPQKPWFDTWPSLHGELVRAVEVAGIAAVVVAAVVVVVAAVGAAPVAAAAALAGFVALLVEGLSDDTHVAPRLI